MSIAIKKWSSPRDWSLKGVLRSIFDGYVLQGGMRLNNFTSSINIK